jgi:hypothetical protein
MRKRYWIAWVLLCIPPAYAADCENEEWRVTASSPNATVRWTVKKGATCDSLNRMNYVESLQRRGYAEGFTIIQQAQHGAAGVTNGIADRGFAYQASGDYTGLDEFKVGCLLRPSMIKCSITVKITVVNGT